MKTEVLGEIFFDGKIVNLDSASIKDLDNMIIEINEKEEDTINKLNRVLAEIQ